MTQEERTKQALKAFSEYSNERGIIGKGWFDKAAIWIDAVMWADDHNFYFQDLNPKETEEQK